MQVAQQKDMNNYSQMYYTNENGEKNASNNDTVITFVVMKFFLGAGWIASIVLAIIIGEVFEVLRR